MVVLSFTECHVVDVDGSIAVTGFVRHAHALLVGPLEQVDPGIVYESCTTSLRASS
jgi:hypothetical protein